MLHAKYIQTQFDLQVAFNDCAVNEFIFTMYEAGLLYIPIESKKLTTTFLTKFVGSDLVTQFGSDMPCKIHVSTTELPEF